MSNAPQYLKPLEAAKAYIALVGTIATALLTVFTADTTVGKVLVVVSIVATAIATYAVPNAKPAPETEVNEYGRGPLS